MVSIIILYNLIGLYQQELISNQKNIQIIILPRNPEKIKMNIKDHNDINIQMIPHETYRQTEPNYLSEQNTNVMQSNPNYKWNNLQNENQYNGYNHNKYDLSDSIPIEQQGKNYFDQQGVNNVSSNKSDGPLSHLNRDLAGAARKGFIKKVYLVLACQLLFTVGMCLMSLYVKDFLKFQVENYWLMWVSLALLIITQIAIFFCPAGRKHPINMILLFIFTLAQSYMVSYICSQVANRQGGAIVLVAALMTLFIVVCLTIYAILTPNDFVVQWGIVIAILAPLVLFGIFAAFAWIPILRTLYCALGAILFGIYLVIDTQLIIRGRRLYISMDDYVVGALLLYIDIVQIFLFLLRILGSRN